MSSYINKLFKSVNISRWMTSMSVGTEWAPHLQIICVKHEAALN